MSAKSRLEDILKYTGKTYNSFAKAIGMPRSQPLYAVRDGEIKEISAALAKKITNTFQDLNYTWILTGEGSMLKDGGEIADKVSSNKPAGNQKQELNKEEDSLLKSLTRSQELISVALAEQATANRISAENQRLGMEANAKLVDEIIAARVGESQTAVDAKFSKILEFVAEVGSGKTKWNSLDEADAVLHTRFYGDEKVGEEVGTHGR